MKLTAKQNARRIANIKDSISYYSRLLAKEMSISEDLRNYENVSHYNSCIKDFNEMLAD